LSFSSPLWVTRFVLEGSTAPALIADWRTVSLSVLSPKKSLQKKENPVLRARCRRRGPGRRGCSRTSARGTRRSRWLVAGSRARAGDMRRAGGEARAMNLCYHLRDGARSRTSEVCATPSPLGIRRGGFRDPAVVPLGEQCPDIHARHRAAQGVIPGPAVAQAIGQGEHPAPVSTRRPQAAVAVGSIVTGGQ